MPTDHEKRVIPVSAKIMSSRYPKRMEDVLPLTPDVNVEAAWHSAPSCEINVQFCMRPLEGIGATLTSGDKGAKVKI